MRHHVDPALKAYRGSLQFQLMKAHPFQPFGFKRKKHASPCAKKEACRMMLRWFESKEPTDNSDANRHNKPGHGRQQADVESFLGGVGVQVCERWRWRCRCRWMRCSRCTRRRRMRCTRCTRRWRWRFRLCFYKIPFSPVTAAWFWFVGLQ